MLTLSPFSSPFSEPRKIHGSATTVAPPVLPSPSTFLIHRRHLLVPSFTGSTGPRPLPRAHFHHRRPSEQEIQAKKSFLVLRRSRRALLTRSLGRPGPARPPAPCSPPPLQAPAPSPSPPAHALACAARPGFEDQTQEPVLMVTGPQGRINRVVSGPLNKTIINADEDATVRICDSEASTGKLMEESDKEVGHQKTITSLAKSADWSYFLTGSLDKTAKDLDDTFQPPFKSC